MTSIRAVSVGLGPIGRTTAALALESRSLRLLGAADVDPAKAGRDLAELLGLEEAGAVRVEADAEAMIGRLRPDIVFLCTSSRLPGVRDDILRAVRAGASVVSSCEEMLWPALRHPELAAELDREAVAHGATVLGTGVNPGFVLDFLPVVASGVCRRVRRVRGLRIVDAGTRRRPLQEKVGAGLTVEEFRRGVEAGRLGHVGMRESVALVGQGLGLELDEVTDEVEPVIAGRQVETRFVRVERGRVAGIRNVGRGTSAGRLLVELELQMYVGAETPGDEIRLEGEPDVTLRMEGGVAGDLATAALLVNSAPQVVAAPPGLKTVLDLPPPRCWGQVSR